VNDTNDPSSTPTPAKLRVKALFHCGMPTEGDLMFKSGDIIEVIQKHANGWWDGVIGVHQGKFPINFVTVSHASIFLHTSSHLDIFSLASIHMQHPSPGNG